MPGRLIVAGEVIDDQSGCYVIAEIGHNHQGSLEKARELFRRAKDCGANAVKLQKRDNRTLFSRALYDAPYENENSFGPTYGRHREALEFGRREYEELLAFASELGLTMFATAFDFKSADFLAELDMPAYKMASGDLRNIPLLRYVARLGRPMFISTGGSTLADVERAWEAVAPLNDQICLMQCTAAYPCEPREMNLRVLDTYRERFPGAVLGLSDHQSGIAMSVVAYVMGARVSEKHFTLNRAMKGTDHAFSLEPEGLRKLVRDLQRAREAMGDGVKRVLPSEEKPIMKMGKAIVAARDLAAGAVLGEADLALKSPAGGLHPYEWDVVVGRKLARPLAADQMLAWEDLEA
ncbi:MAG: N-acetylneuraminate synthase family protein [Deltaproteobacteria bacterium]|nr:N-acetylneuraminate synthase family protein [Deltaproteobacteria bacterium]